MKIKSPVVVIGIGEIGSVLARGFLRIGHPVYPVIREIELAEMAQNVHNPEAVIIAVGETELSDVLDEIPLNWRDSLVLIQNELLPKDWQKYQIDPTVISVWFEKKKGQDVKVVIPSPIQGEKAPLLSQVLNALDIPNVIINDSAEMTFELVRKNYYILTSNIAGLQVGGTVGELWDKHYEFMQDVVADVHKIQEHLTASTLDNDKLIKAMRVAFEGDLQHGCIGRSAPTRLQRALAIADSAGLDIPTLTLLNQQLQQKT